MTTSSDPDVALDDGTVIDQSGRRRPRTLNDRDPDARPKSAAIVRVLGRGFVEEETAHGVMRSPTSDASTSSEDAGMMPEVRAAAEMVVKMTDGPEFRRTPIQRVQTRKPGVDYWAEPGPDYWDGKSVQIDMRLRAGDLGSRPPTGYRLTWSSPETVKLSETAWAGQGTLQPSYVLTNHGVREAANQDSLIAGVLLGAGAGFVAPTLDKLMVFLS